MTMRITHYTMSASISRVLLNLKWETMDTNFVNHQRLSCFTIAKKDINMDYLTNHNINSHTFTFCIDQFYIPKTFVIFQSLSNTCMSDHCSNRIIAHIQTFSSCFVLYLTHRWSCMRCGIPKKLKYTKQKHEDDCTLFIDNVTSFPRL